MKEISYSRLARRQEAKYRRKGAFYILLTLIIITLLIAFGLPGMIKLAAFFGQIKSFPIQSEKEDTIAPFPPTFRPTYEATNSAKINLSGFAEAKSKVEIYVNGERAKEVETNDQGEFLSEEIELANGQNEIYAIATDDSDNSSQPSEKLSIIFSDQPPSVTISEPANSHEFFWPEQQIIVKGETASEAKLSINGRMTPVSSDGKFQFIFRLQPGENKITATSVDPAGNKTEATVVVKYYP